VLHNQFHDILPGSSIHEVYEVSKNEYEKLFSEGLESLNKTLDHITKQIACDDNSLVVFNPNGFKAEGIVEISGIDEAKISLWNGNEENLLQKTESGDIIAYVKEIPAAGYGTVSLNDLKQSVQNKLIVTKEYMENDYFRICINEKGQFSSIFDKRENRELLSQDQAGNVLMTYEDKPHNWDAWDINDYYTEKSWEVTQVKEIKVTEHGPVRGTLKIVHSYLDSEIIQYIRIYQDIPRIDIQTVIDWKETQILLKALFHVDIHASEAVYDIQYGNVKRLTHYNTSWDKARFEVNHHKWLDVSEDGYGVSILNDCKYGCHVHENEIGLTLLKSAVNPNETADREQHCFTYSIYPHKGDFREADTVKQSYMLNNPMIARVKEGNAGNLDHSFGTIDISDPNVILEVVKGPEAGGDSNDMILRFYECFNRRTKTVVRFGRLVKSVSECNLLENEETTVENHGKEAVLEIKPYEIKTWFVHFI
jgi:alpha-mannosidase